MGLSGYGISLMNTSPARSKLSTSIMLVNTSGNSAVNFSLPIPLMQSRRVEKKNQALTSKKKTLSLSDDGKDKVKPAITSNLSSKFSGSKNPSRGSIYSKIKSTDRSTTSLFLRSGESTRSQFAPDAVS